MNSRATTLTILLAVSILTGCQTNKPLIVSPPGTRAAKSFKLPDRRNLKPFDPAKLPKYRFLEWGSCGSQPEGTLYRVYDTDDFSYWALYAETPFTFVPIDVANSICRFYKVSAFLDGVEVFSNSEPCE